MSRSNNLVHPSATSLPGEVVAVPSIVPVNLGNDNWQTVTKPDFAERWRLFANAILY